MANQGVNIAASYWAFKESNIPTGENSIWNKVKKLISNIEAVLFGDANYKGAFFKLFDDALSLRYDSIRLIKSEKEDVGNLLESFSDVFEERKIPEKYEILNENVLYALRTVNRISKYMLEVELDNEAISKLNPGGNSNYEQNIAETPYSRLIHTLSLISQQYPNEHLLKLIDLVDASLYIELGIVAADVLFDKCAELDLNDSRIDELSELIVEKTHDYSSLTRALGITKPKSNFDKKNIEINYTDSEEQELSELGLADYLKNLEKEDE